MKILYTVVALVCFTLTVVAQQDVGSKKSEEKNGVNPYSAGLREGEFQRLAGEWKDAYNSKDATKIALLYTEDADYTSSHVPALLAHGRKEITAYLQGGMDAGGHVDAIEILTSSASCNIAYLVCKYVATNSGQTVSGRNVIVSKKVGGKWLIAVHASIVRD